MTAFAIVTGSLFRDGDACSVQGAFKAELYRSASGEAKISLSIVVDKVLALRLPSKERKPPNRDAPPEAAQAAFDDAIPFGAP